MAENKKPNCHKCEFRREIPGDCHSACANEKANVVGHSRGIQGGWFNHPWNFDPTWLVSCDGFKEKK